MANSKVEDRSEDTRPGFEEEAAILEKACHAGDEAFIRVRYLHSGKLTPGHYIVLDPTTLDSATAPTQAEAIERFTREFPHARGSLHRVGEDFEVP